MPVRSTQRSPAAPAASTSKTAGTSPRGSRGSLSRRQVLAAGLRFVDEHGLGELSMHKLGAVLGVKAMALYKHVANKDDLLDGIVEVMWEEIPVDPGTGVDDGDWRQAIAGLATALRELVHRHPHAAPLLTSRQALQERPLWICARLLEVMRAAAVPEHCAAALLRTVIPYGIGYALAELSMPTAPPDTPNDEVARVRRMTRLFSADAPDELIRTALLVCGECDMTSQFGIGIDLMTRGLDAYLHTQPAAPTTATC